MAGSGRIQYLSRETARWFKHYFGPRADPRRLPDAMADWWTRQDDAPGCWEREGRRLFVTLIDRSRKGAKCYLVEEGAIEAEHLTPCEAEVLFWLRRGKTNREICEILQRTLSTVKKHLEHIYPKLGVENRTAAAYYAEALRHSSKSAEPPAPGAD
jgi:DNA-binding CsgD family transcriptional regulator